VLDEDDSIPILRRALDLGITFFDMADWVFRRAHEEVVGRNLVRMSTRERLVLATKVFYPMSEDPNESRPVTHDNRRLDRPVARAHGDRLRRSVCDSCLRRRDTGRGDHGGAQRHVRAGQSALPRRSTMYAWQFAR